MKMENEKEWVVRVDGFGHTTITAGEVSIAVRGGRDIAEHDRIVSLVSAAPLLLAACKLALGYAGDRLSAWDWAITVNILRAVTAVEGISESSKKKE